MLALSRESWPGLPWFLFQEVSFIRFSREGRSRGEVLSDPWDD